MQLAVQLYTLRDFTKTSEGFKECLEKCKSIGYDGVQLSAVGCMSGENPEVDAALAKKWLDEYELVCCATHRGWSAVSGNVQKEIDFHAALDCHYLAVPSISSEFGYDPDDYRRFLSEAKPVADVLSSAGIKFGYHNHSHEFSRDPFTGKSCLEIFASSENPWLEMEVDTYWVADAGVCAHDFLRHCAGRISAIHVKDREVIPGEGPVMAPVGEGNLDWSAIISACRTGGTEWLIVEQDTCRRDPYSCLESSWTFLTQCLCE